MLLDVQTGTDNPILRTVSTPVTKFDKKLTKLLIDMTQTMLEKDGVGLAAPQIGVNQRIAVLNFQLGKDEWRILPMINPEITQSSKEEDTDEEGCLSLPKIYAKVTRPSIATVKFQNEKGREQTLTMEGLNARAIQHEIDHLDGILFIDKAKTGSIKKEALV